jgi:chitosanase
VWINDLTVQTSNLFPNTTTTTPTWAPPADLVAGRTYRVWVRAVTDAGAGPWGDTKDFTVAVPTRTGPTGSVTGLRPSFSWTGIAGARYEIRLNDLTVGRTNMFPNQVVPGTGWQPPADLVSGRSYSWQVRAINAQGFGTWSTLGTFAVARATITGLPAAVEDRTPTIDWSAISGATAYQVWVNNLTTGKGPIYNVRVPGPTWTPPVDLAGGQQYRIYVRALNEAGLGTWTFQDVRVLTPFTPLPSTGMSAAQKGRAEKLTSVFENDTPQLQYAYIGALGDGRGYTAGRAGFTTATGDFLLVVERYTARVPANPLAPYLPQLRALSRAHSGSTAGLGGVGAAWRAAAADPVFRAVQDQVVDETYYRPALGHWNRLGLRSALSLAALYDAIIQHGDGTDPDGLRALLSRTAARVGGTPATGIDERAWLDAFLVVRRADLANAYNPATRAVWAQSVGRVDVFRHIMNAGNFDLAGPITVVSSVYTNVVIA